MDIFLVHFALAFSVFFIVNWLGSHAKTFGYMQLAVHLQKDEAPAFNFVFRVGSPLVLLILISAGLYLSSFDRYTESIFMVNLYYFAIRVGWNLALRQAFDRDLQKLRQELENLRAEKEAVSRTAQEEERLRAERDAQMETLKAELEKAALELETLRKAPQESSLSSKGLRKFKQAFTGKIQNVLPSESESVSEAGDDEYKRYLEDMNRENKERQKSGQSLRYIYPYEKWLARRESEKKNQ
jgi:hypothetical protein